MTLFRKTLAALMAACMAFTIYVPALAVQDYDMNAPQNLSAEHLYAQSALLIDEDSGEVLFSKNARVRMYPASTTKIMTLLLGIESDIPLDEQVTIPIEAGDIPKGSSVIPVKPGDQISFKDLLYSFMLSSGNDGANAVAVLVDGSIEAFVERMNARAQELGLVGTHYVNAHGYHDAEHYTTAEDLAKLARYAMTNDVFRDVVKQPTWTIAVTRDGETKSGEIISRNSLLQSDQKYYYPDCTGIKTGHHNKAGWCFVGSAERDGMRVICVVLDCEGEMDKWYDAARLFEYGFTRYEDVPMKTLIERAAEGIAPVEIEGAEEGDGSLALELSDVEGGDGSVKLLSGSDAALEQAVGRMAEGMRIEWTRALEAPVTAGEAMGAVTFDLPDGGTATARLLAGRDVAPKPTEAPTAEPVVTEEPSVLTDAPAETNPPAAVTQTQGEGGGGALILGVLAALALGCVGVAWALYREKQKRARRRRARRKHAAVKK